MRANWCGKRQLLELSMPKKEAILSQAQEPIIRRGRRRYTENPSIPAPDSVGRTRPHRIGTNDRNVFITDLHSREHIAKPGIAVFYEMKEVDSEKFVKIYAEGISRTTNLSKTGLSVLEMVLTLMRESPGKDQVMLAYELVPGAQCMSRRNFLRGLGELVANKLIYPCVLDGVFFIDVTCMFNGDRFQLIKEYRIKQLQAELPLDVAA